MSGNKRHSPVSEDICDHLKGWTYEQSIIVSARTHYVLRWQKYSGGDGPRSI